MGCTQNIGKFKKIKSLNKNNVLIYSYLDNNEYNLKIIKTDGLKTKNFENEIKILKKCFHPNIIELKGVFISSKKKLLYIITESPEEGDLQMKIEEAKKNGNHFDENQILDWFMQTCIALDYIHKNKIIHRNIKPSNIFLMKKGYIKLGDFGLSKMLNNSYNKTHTFIDKNQYSYLAPEIINKEDYSYEVDIWDLGVTFYQLMYLEFPFKGETIEELYDNIKEGKINQKKRNYHYSSQLEELIKKMISNRKEERPSLSEILDSSLIKSRMISYLKEQKYEKEEAIKEINNYEKKNKEKFKNEMKKPVLFDEFDYDDEDGEIKGYIPEEIEKLKDEKDIYQYFRAMTLLNDNLATKATF